MNNKTNAPARISLFNIIFSPVPVAFCTHKAASSLTTNGR
jgi:hypothetical protein